VEGLVSDFHLLLEEEIAKLMRYASALARDPDEAEDLVADTIREALAHQRQRSINLRVWLLTLLHDLRGNPFRQMTACSPAPLDPSRQLSLSELDRALGELPDEQRSVILLVGLEGMSYSETATILRITLGTLRARLARGRAALRRAMGVEESARHARIAHAA
jgi:RNA polymerase sigma-70 factor (ECF subfamily)